MMWLSVLLYTGEIFLNATPIGGKMAEPTVITPAQAPSGANEVPKYIQVATQVLDRTKEIRFNVVDKLLAMKDYHKDPKVVGGLAKFLDGLDKQTLTVARLQQEAEIAAANNDTEFAIAAEILKQINSGMLSVDPSMVNYSAQAHPGRSRPPQEIEDAVFVKPGEADCDAPSTSYEEFISKTAG